MNIPLDKPIDTETNVYEMTCLAITEQNIYSATDKKKEIERNGDKVVSVVLSRALNGEIEYDIAKEDQ